MSLLRITMQGLVLGNAHQNVLHFNYQDMPAGTGPATAAAEIRDNWLQQIKTRHGAVLVWNGINVRVLGSTEAPYTLSINIPGLGDSSANYTPFSSFVCQLKTATAGRHGHGRFYLAAVHPGAHVNGIVTASTLTDWASVITTLMNRYGPSHSGPLQLYVAPRNATVVGDAYSCTSLVLRSSLGVQRRRNYGVGI